ncbi:MAG: ParB/RepB/Spo0J family partition protein [Motiliproteus sp.]
MSNLTTTATRETISINDVTADPKMQMRVEMDQDTIEQYTETIDSILEIAPIEIVCITLENTKEVRYIVDGFHRYHAARQAGLKEITVNSMTGTYEDAVQYAMAANWKNGLRPKSSDAARSVGLLLETAPAFGFDSKAVIKWITSFGIPSSTARNHTKELRLEIDADRDSEIIRLNEEEMPQRDIAAAVGCSLGTVNQRVANTSVQNKPLAENEQDADISEASSSLPATDATPVPEPEAFAFNTELEQHEQERLKVTQPVATPPESAASRGVSHDNPYVRALAEIAAAAKRHDSEQLLEEAMSSTDDLHYDSITSALPILKQIIDDRT